MGKTAGAEALGQATPSVVIGMITGGRIERRGLLGRQLMVAEAQQLVEHEVMHAGFVVAAGDP